MTTYTTWQGETGGYITAPYASTIPATSGYAFFVGRGVQYRLDGYTLSGYLYISRSGVASLPPGKYEMLPQVVDSSSRVYFLDPVDIEVESVLGTSETLFSSGDSILNRINNIENGSLYALLASGNVFTATQTITPVASDVGLVIRGASGQTENLFEAQLHDGTVVVAIEQRAEYDATTADFFLLSVDRTFTDADQYPDYTGFTGLRSNVVLDDPAGGSAPNSVIDGAFYRVEIKEDSAVVPYLHGFRANAIQRSTESGADFVIGVRGNAFGRGAAGSVIGGKFAGDNSGAANAVIGVLSELYQSDTVVPLGVIFDGSASIESGSFTALYGLRLPDLSAAGQSAILTQGGTVEHRSGAANAVALILQLAASQTADTLQVKDNGGTAPFRINKSGIPIIAVHTAPADADLSAGDCAIWFDQTNGAAKLKIKAKQADGAVKVGEVLLS